MRCDEIVEVSNCLAEVVLRRSCSGWKSFVWIAEDGLPLRLAMEGENKLIGQTALDRRARVDSRHLRA